MGAIAMADHEVHHYQEDVVPAVPEAIEDTGLPPSLIEQLILKMLYFRGDIIGRDLSTAVGLKFSVIEEIMRPLKQHHLVHVKCSFGIGDVTAQFALTELGRNHAREYLEINQYTGPAPVPLFQYMDMVQKQRPQKGWLTQDNLITAYRHLVVSPRILAQIGPAVSSGNSFLLYGQPGNGKTYLAEALFNLDTSYVYLPYAIECQGMIIQIYDPIYHHPVAKTESCLLIASDAPYDGRWFKCKRPFIVSGGELTLEMLDLSYNSASKVYDAPLQLKANNGIYLMDDFGRQRVTPAEVLNRWIVPMERRVDYLNFRSGGKMTVPFEAFLIFSTNLNPERLGDEAFLRRIQYKMLVRNPNVDEFIEIFERFCASMDLQYPDGLAHQFIEKHYRKPGKPLRRCHPRDVLSHAIDLIHFEKLSFALTEDLLDRAFESCFLEQSEVDQ